MMAKTILSGEAHLSFAKVGTRVPGFVVGLSGTGRNQGWFAKVGGA